MLARRDVAAGVYQGWMERSACTHHHEASESQGALACSPTPHGRGRIRNDLQVFKRQLRGAIWWRRQPKRNSAIADVRTSSLRRPGLIEILRVTSSAPRVSRVFVMPRTAKDKGMLPSQPQALSLRWEVSAQGRRQGSVQAHLPQLERRRGLPPSASVHYGKNLREL